MTKEKRQKIEDITEWTGQLFRLEGKDLVVSESEKKVVAKVGGGTNSRDHSTLDALEHHASQQY